ncbi:hypothetical protein SPHINGO8AM_200076 [Sphingomonas sp. 8AM]|nr:hypothetical protein SPHINGO8AM_200076 [Sphingomonas sp. 8AM]
MTSTSSVIASVAKQSRAGPGRPGLLRYARNDERYVRPHVIMIQAVDFEEQWTREQVPGDAKGSADRP